ncbi:MAG: DUF4366 domain-containing protein [Eubacterium sp.]|nr:DUF4366 domain-containing protein [Eubacterium sp.]
MTKRIKTIISATLAAAVVSAATVTACAESEDTEVTESTTTAESTAFPATTTTSAETTAPVTEPITQSTTVTTTTPATTTALENPFETGMLADDELYGFLMEYLDEGVEFDIDGTGVLVDESIIRATEESEESYDDTEDGEAQPSGYVKSSTEKIMYTITTRDGSMFYIVIDKAKSGENVYFLNNVDIVDLASVINRQAEVDEDGNAVLNKQEREIVNEAANASITTVPVRQPDDENGDTDGESDTDEDGEASETENSGEESSNDSSMTLYLIVGVAAVAIIGVAWYKKMGPGSKKNKATYTEDEDEDETEETVVEEEDIPLEDDYEEE